ncbi:TPA: helix-turn-helix domain-containing protein [Stenotrophomonas maltophilia]|nr:helix-turn-helix domain-containing protein [Stenotrophomonas maltophilia]
MAELRDSSSRLFAAAAKLDPPITASTDLAAALSVSKQRVTNWKSRGVSKEGAIEAQRVLGINVDWILHGQLPMFVSSAESPAVQSQSARQQRQILRDATKLVRLVLDGNIPLTDQQKEDLSDRAVAMVAERWANGFPTELDAYKAALELVAHVQSR